MANISAELAAILAAVYGRDVRGSIHDAIYKINDVTEKAIGAGTEFSNGDPIGTMYGASLYINTDDDDLLVANQTTGEWESIGNIEGNGIASITGPTQDPDDPLKEIYTINFTKLSTPFTFSVDNGKGITSITGPTTVGLIDTYTINYNDGTSQSFAVTNGKDGNTVLRGNEITGTSQQPTQFTLSVKCQTGDTYLNLSGDVYECTEGAAANEPSLWKWSFSMAGGGGGAQVLNDLNDVNTSSAVTGQLLGFNGSIWGPVSGGSGHTMKPDPATHPTEANVVTAINAAGNTDTNNEVASLYGISKWTNVKTFRAILTTGIGHYGVGEWQDYVNNPTATQEQQWGWWHHDIFTKLDSAGYDVDIDIKFDPSGEPVMLGGYIIDTTTGYMCIKFANYVMNPSSVKIAVDVTFTRNDFSS